mgnify:FL=1
MVSKTIEDFSVVIRCHAPKSKVPEEKTELIVSLDHSQNIVKLTDPDTIGRDVIRVREFPFERIYDWNVTQEAFFDQVPKPLIQDAMEGYNGTILAYGETGSGKTYTIQGNLAYEDQYGIIPRAAEEIFKIIETTPSKQYLVYCCFLSIYNEKLNDLLSSSSSVRLGIRESPELGVYVKDAMWCQVKNHEEMLELYRKGLKTGDILSTMMGITNTRTTTIFHVRLESVELNAEGKPEICVSNLHFVDMPGSQSPYRREGSNTSTSLTTFRLVIAKLAAKAESTRRNIIVPYRDSVLTRLLEQPLRGNAKIVFIATILPNSGNFDETLSTLRHASEAKKIKMTATINKRNSLLEEIHNELESLKAELRVTHIDLLQEVVNPEAGEANGNHNQQVNQIDMNENEVMIEGRKDYATREKENIEMIIDSIMKSVQKIGRMIDEEKSKVWKALKEKEKTCDKVIEHRVTVETAILKLKVK